VFMIRNIDTSNTGHELTLLSRKSETHKFKENGAQNQP
jgi:hypothetical protein